MNKKFIVRDWMSAEVHEFITLSEAKSKFNDIKKQSKNNAEECDIQLYIIIEEFNNID